MKKKTKRSQHPYPNLEPGLNSRVRQEYMDADYIDQLNDAEKAWLNQFYGEFYQGTLVLDDSNEIIPTKNLHKDPSYKKDIYDANNARNRCQYGRIKARVANTKLLNYDDVINLVEQQMLIADGEASVENAYNEYLAHGEMKHIIREYEDFMKSYREYCE
jgi:hypothetical protein